MLLGLVACCGCGPAEIDVADAPTIRFAGDPYGDTDAIEVTGLSPSALASLDELTTEQWVDALAVFTEAAADDPGAPVVLGDYRIDAGRVLFTPRFPFAPGMSYLARFAPPSGIEPIEWTFSIPEVTGASTTRVAEIFPSAATWPMNQLKMYVHFSGPMRTGRAFDFIRLIDEDTGIEVEQPFVTLQEELWDQTHETLTILYDPGRIKRGLVPNQEAGLPLQTGRSYRLVIDAGWPDTDGRLLEEPYEHHFSIGEIDRTSPHPNGWILTVPGAETRDPWSWRSASRSTTDSFTRSSGCGAPRPGRKRAAGPRPQKRLPLTNCSAASKPPMPSQPGVFSRMSSGRRAGMKWSYRRFSRTLPETTSRICSMSISGRYRASLAASRPSICRLS